MRNKNTAAVLGALAIAGVIVTGCGKNSPAASGPVTFTPVASAPVARASSVMADPIASADVTQAKKLVAKCIPGTPVQQLHTLHLLFASKTGKNAQAGEQTRARIFGCLGIPADQRANFENDALTRAEHGHLTTTAGRKTYFEVTLPQLVATYQARP